MSVNALEPKPKSLAVFAKSPRDWGNNELNRLRITRKRITSLEELCPTQRPVQFKWKYCERLKETLDEDDVDDIVAGGEQVLKISRLIKRVVLVDHHRPELELETTPSAANLLIYAILEAMGFRVKEKQELLVQHGFSMKMNGSRISTEVDVCIVDYAWSYFLFLVVQDRLRPNTLLVPFAELMGVCIAAFQWNNKLRCCHGLDPLPYMVFPAMIMKGTNPVFYVVKITQDLSDACTRNEVPQNPTEVLEFNPLAYMSGSGPYGMFDRGNRQMIFQCLENLRDLIPKNPRVMPQVWKRVMEPHELGSSKPEANKKS